MIALIRLMGVSVLLAVAFSNAGGCAPAVGTGGDLAGVGPGGAQDVALARNDIARGVVPNPDSLTVAGFLREHDIPLATPSGAPEIFASLSGAWRVPFNEPAAMGELYLGLGTTRDLGSFMRRPLNVVLLIDISASMLDSPDDSYFYPPLAYSLFGPIRLEPQEVNGSKLELARTIAYRVLDQLGPDDLVSIVTFNQDSHVLTEGVSVTDSGALGDVIAALKGSGNTNLEQGLRLGFQTALDHHSDTRLDRVILVTDALPTEGLQATGDFTSLVGQYAEQNAGLTLIGVGTDFGVELGLAISALRGGNSFYLNSLDRVNDVIPNEFKFFTTPAAYDLTLRVSHDETVGIRDVFGVSDYAGSPTSATITLPTLFFSRREGGGAIVVRFSTAQPPDFSADRTFGSVQLTYTLPDGSQPTQTTALTIPAGTAASGDPPYFSDLAARRAAALVDVAVGLHDAAERAYSGDFDGGAELLGNLADYFDTATLGLSDRIDGDSRSLSDEADLIEEFLALVRARRL